MKSQIYNLIILDESGSMGCITRQTISGCNETIDTIRVAQKDFEETQEHFVSIFAFQSGGNQPSRYLIKNAPIAEVENITSEQYSPCGCTPLYDAVGATLTDLKATTKDHPMAIGSVTIITDGMENSSHHYTLSKVAMMIEALKEMGWSFNFIGANIDVNAVANSLKIDNVMEFKQDDEGTAEMFRKEQSSRKAWLKRADAAIQYCCSASVCMETIPEELNKEYRKRMKKAAKNYFKSSEEETDK